MGANRTHAGPQVVPLLWRPDVTTRTHTMGRARLVVGLLGCIVLLCSLFSQPAGGDPASDKRAEARRIAQQLSLIHI